MGTWQEGAEIGSRQRVAAIEGGAWIGNGHGEGCQLGKGEGMCLDWEWTSTVYIFIRLNNQVNKCTISILDVEN